MSLLTAKHLHNHHGHRGDSSASSNELHFKVEGMTCAGCAAAVQRAIESRPGVKSAAISVTQGRATVIGDELNPATIVKAIQDGGYDAELIEHLASPAELRSEIELRQSGHEREWRRRAIIGLSIWAPLEILHWVSHSLHAHVSWIGWVLLIGATVVLFVSGAGFYRSAWNAAKRFTTNMDTLIAIGATTAYLFSLVVFIAQQFGALMDQPLYFAESAALFGIISLGHWMEARATAKAGSAVRELLELQPDQAEIVTHAGPDDQWEEGPDRSGASLPVVSGSSSRWSSDPASGVSQTRLIPSADVQPGNHLLIRPGSRIPVDGSVIEGESDIDESVVTGESMPVHKTTGDHVVAGSMNTTGRMIIEANVDGRHTTIARIAEMVQRAQSSKADIQRLADRVAAIFVPAVLLIALITLIGWSIAGDFATGVISTVTVLIISCPCAMGLATPMAVMVGAGSASRRGILIKSAAALETAGNSTHVVFDKTGTLTVGAAAVTAVTIEKRGTIPFSDNELLSIAASVEAPSEHPIAKAIVRAAAKHNLSIPPVRDFQAIPGQGVRGVVNGKTITVIRDESATCRVEIDGEIVGRINVADELRPDARQAIDQLRAMGLTVTMLSGDRRAVAEAVGAELGLQLHEIRAEQSPESKCDFIAQLSYRLGSDLSRRDRAKPQAAGAVIMVGDGINDAAALAQADLGIAIASGTNIAIESADVVIPGNRVTAVPETIHIARLTLKTIKQNLFFAFFYNVIAIPAAAFGLLGLYGPLIAAAAMGLSDITVIGNAIRLKRKLHRR